METVILRGEPAKLARLYRSGSGSGSGDGDGYGDGYGSGSGYGDGSGSGDGDGYGSGSGYGSGYGSGSGSGDGDGYGSGSGYGDGDGDGSGYGDGDGSGSGSGDGSGSGSGDGDGYGDGYGSGSGYGDGSEEYWQATILNFAAKWPQEVQAKYEAAKLAGATIAFWRSSEKGLPSNGGGKLAPAAPGVIHTAPGPLSLCDRGTLHATLIPPKWKGERYWIVALHGEVIGDEEKYGCLKREILGEAL
jgi:hypothetical protein